jgi:hypothetical protein
MKKHKGKIALGVGALGTLGAIRYRTGAGYGKAGKLFSYDKTRKGILTYDPDRTLGLIPGMEKGHGTSFPSQ